MKFSHLKIVSGAVDATKMECQEEKLKHFRHILLFEFNRGAKAAEAARTFAPVNEDNAIGENTARKWLSCFEEDRFDSLGRPSGFHEDRLDTLIHNDSRKCTRELANVMNCEHSTIVRHLHSMDKVKNRVYGHA